MNREYKDLGGYFDTLAQGCLRAQTIRIKEYWETKASRILSGAAQECLTILGEIAPLYYGQGLAMKDHSTMQGWLVMNLTKMLWEKAEELKSLLHEMAGQEAGVIADILFQNGFPVELPQPQPSAGDIQKMTAELWNGKGLDLVYIESFLDFSELVIAELGQLWISSNAPDLNDQAGAPWLTQNRLRALMGRLEHIAGAWRRQLEMISRTAVHGINCKIRSIAMESMGGIFAGEPQLQTQAAAETKIQKAGEH